jgi:hypothetical protein
MNNRQHFDMLRRTALRFRDSDPGRYARLIEQMNADEVERAKLLGEDPPDTPPDDPSPALVSSTT